MNSAAGALYAVGLDVFVDATWSSAERLNVLVDSAAVALGMVSVIHAAQPVRRVVGQFTVLLAGVAVTPDVAFLVTHDLALGIAYWTTNPSFGAVELALISTVLISRIVDLTILRIDSAGDRVDPNDLIGRHIDGILAVRRGDDRRWWNDDGTPVAWNNDLSSGEVSGDQNEQSDECCWLA